MATTQKNFVALSSTALVGSSAAGVALALTASSAASYVQQGLATALDKFTVDLAKAGYAKNGCVLIVLAASTPVTIDLTALSSQPITAGDLVFATWKDLVFTNLGSTDVIVSPGASNPLTTPLAGTSPTFTVYGNTSTRWTKPAGVTIDSTHKTLKFDPGGSGATIACCIGGT